MKIVKGTKTFSLPGEESSLDFYKNDSNIDIVDRLITPCPKEGIILYMIEYEETVEE